jgi:hypothetical protein
MKMSLVQIFGLFTVHHATISRFKIKLFLKFVTALYVSAYSARPVNKTENSNTNCNRMLRYSPNINGILILTSAIIYVV